MMLDVTAVDVCQQKKLPAPQKVPTDEYTYRAPMGHGCSIYSDSTLYQFQQTVSY